MNSGSPQPTGQSSCLTDRELLSHALRLVSAAMEGDATDVPLSTIIKRVPALTALSRQDRLAVVSRAERLLRD